MASKKKDIASMRSKSRAKSRAAMVKKAAKKAGKKELFYAGKEGYKLMKKGY